MRSFGEAGVSVARSCSKIKGVYSPNNSRANFKEV